MSLNLTGCAVLIGQVKPAEEPMNQKSLMIPTLSNPWRLMKTQDEGADRVYQDSSTGSTLSFTSGCRKSATTQQGEEERELRRISASLSGGLAQIQRRKQVKASLDGNPAIDSTIEGKAQGRTLVIRTLVTRKENCVYDVTLVSLKRFFDTGSTAMDSWISGIRLP